MIYIIGLIVWLEISLLFECWTSVKGWGPGPLYKFFVQDSPFAASSDAKEGK